MPIAGSISTFSVVKQADPIPCIVAGYRPSIREDNPWGQPELPEIPVGDDVGQLPTNPWMNPPFLLHPAIST